MIKGISVLNSNEIESIVFTMGQFLAANKSTRISTDLRELLENSSKNSTDWGTIYQTNFYFYITFNNTHFLMIRKSDLKLMFFTQKNVIELRLLEFRPPYYPNSEKKWNLNYHKLR